MISAVQLPLRALCFILTSSLLVAAETQPVMRVAGVVTEYRTNSHADVILSRLLETETLDGKGRKPMLQLVSLYVDQTPKNDLSQGFSQQYGFRLSPTIKDALTFGTGKLAVDGVIMVAEHGKYPDSETGNTIYPKRRFFGEIARVFEESGRVVPVFSDKHLSDNTADALWLYETAQRLHVPLMAGTSITTTWRAPAKDIAREEPLHEIVVLSYGSLDAYGFHAVELVQALAERRPGGETGVTRVRCLTGDAVWDTPSKASYDRELLSAAVAELKISPLRPGKTLQELVRQPTAFVIDYQDGLRATVLTLNGAVAEWVAAWRTTPSAEPQALNVDLQNDRPFMHFAHLLHGIEAMMHTGKPSWPVERTLFSSIMLDAALTSKLHGGKSVDTPALHRSYTSTWNWAQPDNAGR